MDTTDLAERLRRIVNKPFPWDSVEVRRRKYRVTDEDSGEYAEIEATVIDGEQTQIIETVSGNLTISLKQDELLFRTDTCPNDSSIASNDD